MQVGGEGASSAAARNGRKGAAQNDFSCPPRRHAFGCTGCKYAGGMRLQSGYLGKR